MNCQLFNFILRDEYNTELLNQLKECSDNHKTTKENYKSIKKINEELRKSNEELITLNEKLTAENRVLKTLSFYDCLNGSTR